MLPYGARTFLFTRTRSDKAACSTKLEEMLITHEIMQSDLRDFSRGIFIFVWALWNTSLYLRENIDRPALIKWLVKKQLPKL